VKQEVMGQIQGEKAVGCENAALSLGTVDYSSNGEGLKGKSEVLPGKAVL